MPFRMASPEELENAAELNSNAAKALEEEAGVLEERELPIKAKGKLQEAEDVRDKAKLMRQRALLLRQQHMGELAVQAVLCLGKNRQAYGRAASGRLSGMAQHRQQSAMSDSTSVSFCRLACWQSGKGCVFA